MDVLEFKSSGELSDLTIKIDDDELKLHKFPLFVKCQHIKEILNEKEKEDEIKLEEFPGGVEIFNIIADFCYGKGAEYDITNVAAVNCAAHYLKMEGSGNLIKITDKNITEILRSVKASKTVNPLIDLLLQYDKIGERGLESEMANNCFRTFVEVMAQNSTRTPSSHSNRAFEGGEMPYESRVIIDRLLKMKPESFTQLFLTYMKREDSNKRNAADLAVKYLYRVFQKNKKEFEETKPDGVIGFEKMEKSDGDSDKKKKSSKYDSDNEKEDENEGIRDVKTILDTLVMAFEEPKIIGDSCFPEWLKYAIDYAYREDCDCKETLVDLAGGLLHRFNPNELRMLSPHVLGDVIEKSSAEPLHSSQMGKTLSSIVDKELLEKAQSGNLSNEDFLKLMKSLQAKENIDYDCVFAIVDCLLEKDSSIKEDEKKELCDTIDFSKCSEENIQKALENEMVDSKELCMAAIKLASKLRKEPKRGRNTLRDDYMPSRSNFDGQYDSNPSLAYKPSSYTPYSKRHDMSLTGDYNYPSSDYTDPHDVYTHPYDDNYSRLRSKYGNRRGDSLSRRY